MRSPMAGRGRPREGGDASVGGVPSLSTPPLTGLLASAPWRENGSPKAKDEGLAPKGAWLRAGPLTPDLSPRSPWLDGRSFERPLGRGA